MTQKILFLDRDGPVNIVGPKGFVCSPQHFHLTDGITEVCQAAQEKGYVQMDIFTDYAKIEEEKKEEKREKNMQKAMLSIKKKFGKNAILKGMNLEEGATAKDRNSQIGGHKA